MTIKINGDNTVANPGFSGDDTDTGLQVGTNELKLVTGGTARATVDSSGVVKIGTGSTVTPSTDADDFVIDKGSADTGLSILSTVTGRIYFGDAADDQAGSIRYTHSDNSMRFDVASSEVLRIDSSGNVGIGLTNISGSGSLTLVAGQSYKFAGSGGNTIYGDISADTSHNITFKNNNGTERMRIDSSGRVGINDTTPDARLDIGGDDADIRLGGSQYFRIKALSTGELTFNDNDTNERMRIDSSGSVGIGTTSPGDKLTVGDTADSFNSISIESTNTGIGELRFADSDSANPAYVKYEHTGNNLIFAANASERMRIDSSGRLLVGTSSAISGSSTNDNLQLVNSAGSILSVASSDTTIGDGTRIGEIEFWGQPGSTWGHFASITVKGDAAANANDNPGRIQFSTTADGASTPTERMRITNDGFQASTSSSNGIEMGVTAAAGTSTLIFRGRHSATAGSFASGTVCFNVFSNGNVTNTNNSYGAISDIKLKENIVDANSQWNDIKALQVRNYNFIEGQTHTQIGVVAQEVETVSPGLVSESPDTDEEGNDLGTVTKSVNYSVLYMKAVKALQEAMDRIETLETQNADLTARITALETA